MHRKRMDQKGKGVLGHAAERKHLQLQGRVCSHPLHSEKKHLLLIFTLKKRRGGRRGGGKRELRPVSGRVESTRKR